MEPESENPSYLDKFHRNIGIISDTEQEKLRNTTVAIGPLPGVSPMWPFGPIRRETISSTKTNRARKSTLR